MAKFCGRCLFLIALFKIEYRTLLIDIAFYVMLILDIIWENVTNGPTVM